jgi:hypothetical protein
VRCITSIDETVRFNLPTINTGNIALLTINISYKKHKLLKKMKTIALILLLMCSTVQAMPQAAADMIQPESAVTAPGALSVDAVKESPRSEAATNAEVKSDPRAGATTAAEVKAGTGANATATGASMCTKYASIAPGTKMNGVTLTELMTPKKLNQKVAIRHYMEPGTFGCKNGGCWSCLMSPQTGFYKGSTLEECTATKKFSPQGEHGNGIAWKIVPNGKGPEGIQLYDIMGVDGAKVGKTDSEDWRVVLPSVAFGKLKIEDTKDTFLMKRFQNPDLADTVVIFQPCTGKMLTNDIDKDGGNPMNDKEKLGCQLFEKPFSYVTSAPLPIVFWNIRDWVDVNQKDPSTPISI